MKKTLGLFYLKCYNDDSFKKGFIMDIKKLIYAHKTLVGEGQDDASLRWKQKNIVESSVIYDCQSLENINLKGIGSLKLGSKDGYKDCLILSTNTDIENITPRPVSELSIKLDHVDLRSYNRISILVYPEAKGHQNFYFHFSLFNENTKGLLHAPGLTPNMWNQVVFEIEDYQRDNITHLSMTPYLMGCPPEGLGELNVYYTQVEAQKVDCDYVDGWFTEDRIAYCHSGYFIDAEKVALTQECLNDTFYLYDENDKVVYSNVAEEVKTDLGTFFKMDFTSITQEGTYYLRIDDRKTHKFLISNYSYDDSIWKSINFLYTLRCGDDISGVHSPCHLNHYNIHPDGRFVPAFGGWHDAGDVSQFEICTAEIAHSLLDLSERVNDEDLKSRLLDEARWGLNWLLRTRFNDGYRALAVHYSIWRKNIIASSGHLSKNNPLYNNNAAENGPFENFLAAACEAVGARVFKDLDPTFADWCLRAAVDDFWFGVNGYKEGLFTKRWGPSPDCQISGAASLAASELYLLTKNNDYIKTAEEYANIILASQQASYPIWDIPIRGFFYEDCTHAKILTYEHRGHEQSPIQGLCRLYEVCPNHPSRDKWLKGIELYSEYILSTIEYGKPYNLLPAHIYQYSKLNFDRFTIPKTWGTEEEVKQSFKNQIESGIKLNDEVYLRLLPIAIQRRGYHATLLSKAKAVSLCSRVLKSDKLKQIAISQLEWILGMNPFATSTMYGEGHNYHPLYVAFSPQLIGALPVGFKTKDDRDTPYWPVVNNAVFKEIWGHTTAKYLWVLADLLK